MFEIFSETLVLLPGLLDDVQSGEAGLLGVLGGTGLAKIPGLLGDVPNGETGLLRVLGVTGLAEIHRKFQFHLEKKITKKAKQKTRTEHINSKAKVMI